MMLADKSDLFGGKIPQLVTIFARLSMGRPTKEGMHAPSIIPSMAIALLLGSALGASISGCVRPPDAAATTRVSPEKSVEGNLVEKLSSPLESTNILRSFAARGVIRELPNDGATVVIRHEEIPDFMPRMTMAFEVRDRTELRGLQPGDSVVFTIRATEDDSWVEGIRRAGPGERIDLAPKDPSSKALLHVATLQPGDKMPDAELLGENGGTIRFSDFAGDALAFTFIFTRCPLPNYCPRMNGNFNQARDLLFQNVEGPSNWQFLSISFDPEFDHPGVLNRYAFSYRGTITNRWMFAAAPVNVLTALSPQLDFRFANERGSFQHNLRTVVLDPAGRVHQFFEGNKWTAEELAASIVQAASKSD
jgi:protein SCO1/2